MWKSGQPEGDKLLLLLSGDWGSNSSAQPGNSGFYMLSPFAGPKASGSLSVCLGYTYLYIYGCFPFLYVMHHVPTVPIEAR